MSFDDIESNFNFETRSSTKSLSTSNTSNNTPRFSLNLNKDSFIQLFSLNHINDTNNIKKKSKSKPSIHHINKSSLPKMKIKKEKKKRLSDQRFSKKPIKKKQQKRTISHFGMGLKINSNNNNSDNNSIKSVKKRWFSSFSPTNVATKGNITPSNTMSNVDWRPNLGQIMSDFELHNAFVEYSQRTYCDENINFLTDLKRLNTKIELLRSKLDESNNNNNNINNNNNDNDNNNNNNELNIIETNNNNDNNNNNNKTLKKNKNNKTKKTKIMKQNSDSKLQRLSDQIFYKRKSKKKKKKRFNHLPSTSTQNIFTI